jgi:hypothetical protein
MNYELDDNTSYYEEAPQPPAIDTSQFVPVDKYNELEGKFNQAMPQLDYINKMQQVFSPQEKTPEELFDEQSRQFVDSRAKHHLDPVLQKIEQLEQKYDTARVEAFEPFVKSIGLPNVEAADQWLVQANRALYQSGDPALKQIAEQIATHYNSGNLGQLKQTVSQNLQTVNNYMKNHGYWALNVPTQQPQSFGQSFQNNPYANSQSSVADMRSKAQQLRFTDPEGYQKVMQQMKDAALSSFN